MASIACSASDDLGSGSDTEEAESSDTGIESSGPGTETSSTTTDDSATTDDPATDTDDPATDTDDPATDTDDPATDTDDPPDPGVNPSACPAGEVAVGYDGSELLCASLEADARDAMNDNCQVYLGWRDGCNNCDNPPVKWGHAGGSCFLVAGEDSQCANQNLGGNMIAMLGINTDGTVNDDDKFYVGFDCAPVDPETSINAMCPAGQYVVGIDGEGEVNCADLASLVADWGNESCQAYMGWRDNCQNCPDAPSKWTSAGGPNCNPGMGSGNICSLVNVMGRNVNLGAFDTDGTVDGNDSFYLSVDCRPAEASQSTGVAEQCPAGEFVSAIDEDGLLTCTGAGALASDYLRENCNSYIGWRDGCNGCQEAPSEWASTSSIGCALNSPNGVCGQHTLGNSMQWMGSITTSGSVNGDDKFYAAFTCK